VNFIEEIKIGASALGIPLTSKQSETLTQYLDLLRKWNSAFSLTAIAREDWVRLHILDSLSVLPHLDGQTLADVGSGPGFPGIPLAIARPDWSVTLIESNGKKAAFLTQAVLELKLPNVEIHSGRVEEFRPTTTFDIVISRAFATLAKFVRLTGHLCGYSGTLAAMKAEISKTEIDQLDSVYEVKKIVSLSIVDSSLKRSLILLQRPRVPHHQS
jgi:16S rRNA (guanine527-N7)-methyltransferase